MHKDSTLSVTRLPLFSVIVCSYNRAGLITRALDSLCRQSEPDWECIVVDDGSTDDTCAVVQNYADSDSRFRLISKSNGGVASARNAGVRNAKGQFVVFLDSDDEYDDERLAVIRQILIDNPGLQFLHEVATIIGNEYVPDMHDTSKLIHINECVIGGTFVIRRDVFENIGLFDEGAYADDALFYHRALNAGISVAKSPYPTYRYYRDTQDSICTTLNNGLLGEETDHHA